MKYVLQYQKALSLCNKSEEKRKLNVETPHKKLSGLMAILLSLRSKLVVRLMSIPYDTKEVSLQAEIKRLTKEIELVNRKINSL